MWRRRLTLLLRRRWDRAPRQHHLQHQRHRHRCLLHRPTPHRAGLHHRQPRHRHLLPRHQWPRRRHPPCRLDITWSLEHGMASTCPTRGTPTSPLLLRRHLHLRLSVQLSTTPTGVRPCRLNMTLSRQTARGRSFRDHNMPTSSPASGCSRTSCTPTDLSNGAKHGGSYAASLSDRGWTSIKCSPRSSSRRRSAPSFTLPRRATGLSISWMSKMPFSMATSRNCHQPSIRIGPITSASS